MKKIFTFLMLCLLSVPSVRAEKEIYGVLTDAKTVLTLYYDELRAERGGFLMDVWAKPTEVFDGVPTVEYAKLDESMKDARPFNTMSWFSGYTGMKYIVNLDYLNTSNVTQMNSMFSHCHNLLWLDLSHFNTSKLENTYDMFWQCYSLGVLDISNFNIQKLNRTNGMFGDCTSLTTIYYNGDWTPYVSQVASESMFVRCPNLVGGQGTAFDENHTDIAWARTDGGPSSPGYFKSPNTVTLKIVYELRDKANPTLWPSERLADYITPHPKTAQFINKTSYVERGYLTLPKDFTSQAFVFDGYKLSTGAEYDATTSYISLYMDRNLTVTCYFRPKPFTPEAKTSSARYGTASVTYTQAPNIAMDEHPELYADDWNMTYTATPKENCAFYEWVPTWFVTKQHEGNEQAALEGWRQRRSEMSEKSPDSKRYELMQRFTQPTFTLTAEDLEEFVSMVLDSGKLSMYAIQNKEQGVESVQSSALCSQKRIRNGQLLIERNGKTYNAQGAEVK